MRTGNVVLAVVIAVGLFVVVGNATTGWVTGLYTAEKGDCVCNCLDKNGDYIEGCDAKNVGGVSTCWHDRDLSELSGNHYCGNQERKGDCNNLNAGSSEYHTGCNWLKAEEDFAAPAVVTGDYVPEEDTKQVNSSSFWTLAVIVLLGAVGWHFYNSKYRKKLSKPKRKTKKRKRK